MTTKKKKTVRKQSSSRLSTIAGRVLRSLPDPSWDRTRRGVQHVLDGDQIRLEDVRALAASVLSQDETKGQKRK